MTVGMTFRQLCKHIRDCFRKTEGLKVEHQDTLPWTIIGDNIKLKKFAKMYNGYHVRYKYRFLKPLMYVAVYLGAKLNKKVMGKSWIDIKTLPKHSHNKLLNICNDTMDQTLRESALILRKDVKGYNDPTNAEPERMVKLLYDGMMQNVIYDTYYRGVFEMYVLNLAINVSKAYEKDKKHVLYQNKSLHDVEYLMATQRNDGSYFVVDEKDYMIIVPKGAAIRIEKQKIQNILDKKEKNKGEFQ